MSVELRNLSLQHAVILAQGDHQGDIDKIIDDADHIHSYLTKADAAGIVVAHEALPQ